MDKSSYSGIALGTLWNPRTVTHDSIPRAGNEHAIGNSDASDKWVLIAIDLVKYGIGTAISVYFANVTLRLLLSALDSSGKTAAQQAAMKKSLAVRLKRPEIEHMTFDEYELRLLDDITSPNDIDVGFENIGGMDAELEEVNDNIVLPIQWWIRHKTLGNFSTCPTGVLLYGAPGTGKSLTAKAIAKESGATFINIKASSIMDKYLGETDRIVSGMFRLARKLAPTVIFVDEIETVLRKRGDSQQTNQAVVSMQGVFLSEWDGLTQDNQIDSPTSGSTVVALGSNNRTATPHAATTAPVVVLGATNRPSDLDPAFLRRMPVQIQTVMPNAVAREAILRKHLKTEAVAAEVNLQALALASAEFSGSDLRELVRVAKQQRAKVFAKQARDSLRITVDTKDGSSCELGQLPPLSKDNFVFALEKTSKSAAQRKEFGKTLKFSDILES